MAARTVGSEFEVSSSSAAEPGCSRIVSIKHPLHAQSGTGLEGARTPAAGCSGGAAATWRATVDDCF